jgi:hypothetical protein
MKRATPEMEQFYAEAMAAVQVVIKKYPNIRTKEVIAMLARATGYAIAGCYPDERDLARQMAIENMDMGTAHVAIPGPTRPGVDQDKKP